MRLGVALLATIITLVVVVLGAYTRLSDAGLGCPDWPGCYGHIGVPDTEQEVNAANNAYPERPVDAGKAWKEMIHRYAAGILGLLILVIFVQAWTGSGQQAGERVFASGLLALVIFQALLGMWTVTLLVKPFIVSAHLLGGMATLSLLWLLVLQRCGGFHGVAITPFQRNFTLVMLAVLVIQILLGGWTSTNYAALACVGLPKCNGLWLPPMDFANGFKPWHGLGIDYEGGILDSSARVAIHFTHRMGALITVAVIGAGALMLFNATTNTLLRRCALITALMLVVQFSLGLANIWFYLPLPVAVAHNGVAALLLLSVITLIYLGFAEAKGG